MDAQYDRIDEVEETMAELKSQIYELKKNQIDADSIYGFLGAFNEVWLQVCRCGNSFAFHYSVDGKKFYMTRFFNLPVGETVKVGLLPQAPVGNGGTRFYTDLTFEQKTVKNIRMGE